MKSRNWAIGESVVVKAGVTDPDTGRDIGGWQGRISAILDEAEILTIQWDSLTLKSMPPALLAWREDEGLSWSDQHHKDVLKNSGQNERYVSGIFLK